MRSRVFRWGKMNIILCGKTRHDCTKTRLLALAFRGQMDPAKVQG